MTKMQWDEYMAPYREGKQTTGQKISWGAVRAMITAYDESDGDLTNATKIRFYETSYKDRFFVIDKDTEKILIHPNSDWVGKDAVFLTTDTLANHTKGYVNFQDINLRDGDLDDAVAWLQYHDGLLFGAFSFETNCYEPEDAHGCDG